MAHVFNFQTWALWAFLRLPDSKKVGSVTVVIVKEQEKDQICFSFGQKKSRIGNLMVLVGLRNCLSRFFFFT